MTALTAMPRDMRLIQDRPSIRQSIGIVKLDEPVGMPTGRNTTSLVPQSEERHRTSCAAQSEERHRTSLARQSEEAGRHVAPEGEIQLVLPRNRKSAAAQDAPQSEEAARSRSLRSMEVAANRLHGATHEERHQAGSPLQLQ